MLRSRKTPTRLDRRSLYLVSKRNSPVAVWKLLVPETRRYSIGLKSASPVAIVVRLSNDTIGVTVVRRPASSNSPFRFAPV